MNAPFSPSIFGVFAALFVVASPLATAAPGDSQPSQAAKAITGPAAIPGALSALEMLRLLDAGKDQWAIEADAAATQRPTVKELLPYFKVGSPLHQRLKAAKPDATEVTLVEDLSPVRLPAAGETVKVSKDWADRFTREFLRPYGE